MRLSRVVIAGFKTFARRTEVVLEPRITALVGPNGSGKSNFVDAIRWALGETNARELRGARMDEVIHAGGGLRGRLGVAEVELVLDNEEGRLAVEGTEVCVMRRVVRDGESEFRLNGDRVRLRDLERVLAPTGLTQSGYAVVAQHDIDDIIQATPARRRSLVEQAAGVRSLRAACDDASGRVVRAETVLRRLADFLAEAEPRLDELTCQAEVAREQRQLTARLAELRGSLAREEWRAARARLKQARRRSEAAGARAEAAAAAEAGFQARIDHERQAVARARERQASTAAAVELARLAAERAGGEVRRWSDRRDIGALQRAHAAGDVASGVAELDGLRTRVAELESGAGAQEWSPTLTPELLGVRGEHARVAELLASADPDAAVAAAIGRGDLAGRRLRSTYVVIDPADEIAVEAALETHLEGWLVEDADSALGLLDPGGSREHVVRAGLDLPRSQPSPPMGARAALGAIRVTDPAAVGALSRCLENTWLVRDRTVAAAVASLTGGTAVSPDGAVVTPAWLRAGAAPGRERRFAAIEAALREAETEAARAGLARLEREDRRRRLAAARAEEAALRERLRVADLRLLSAEAEVVAAVARAGVARAQAAGARADVETAATAHDEVLPGLQEAERRLAAIDAERSEVAVARARAEDEQGAAQREVEAAAALVAELAAALREDEADAGPEPDAQAAERAEREIVRLERRIGQLGPVNAFAPEQEVELSRRVATVRGNHADLEGACRDLRSVAQRLGEEGERRFEAVFGAVSLHVQELFGELFPGGRATLRLERPPDGADAGLPGVEILAQPPGKRLQPLSLLSGGERALTALAVILGLQQVNPSPFYVFDEVDAALDDGNVTRFTRMLTRLATSQQFVVVSHNHITMAAADALYGVTIDREGVSSILSVRLDTGDTESSGRIVAIPARSVEAAV